MAIEIDWQSLDADGNWLERDRAAKLQAKLEAIGFKTGASIIGKYSFPLSLLWGG